MNLSPRQCIDNRIYFFPKQMHVKTSELMMIDRMFNGDIQEEIMNMQIDISNTMANPYNKASRREHDQVSSASSTNSHTTFLQTVQHEEFHTERDLLE